MKTIIMIFMLLSVWFSGIAGADCADFQVTPAYLIGQKPAVAHNTSTGQKASMGKCVF